MKALKISLVLIAAVLLTVSFVSKESAVQDDTTTYKKYNSQKVVLDKDKKKLKSNA